MTGVNLAEASQPSAGSSTHGAPFHSGTHREGLVLRPMRRSVPAGRSETIGLPRDTAQRTHCFNTAKASTGMQYGAAGNFTAYLYHKSPNLRKAPRLPSDTLVGIQKRDRQRAGLDRHQIQMRISFLQGDSLQCCLC